MKKAIWRSFISLALILALSNLTFGYSVLTHQAVIDLVWKDDFERLLLKRFPGLTEEQLREAHAHAYGGCIIQDMGYYPFSRKFFSDLLHYVRTGDFVEALIAESQDANEYAFALGALAHYASDNLGHSICTNRVVPIYYPKLRKKYGDVVTYEQSPSAHIKAEFGFDVLQVARGHYAPENYHDFIGFKVSKPLLDRVLRKTYGLGIKDIFSDDDLAFNTFRRTVSKTIPFATKVAWELKKDELAKLDPNLKRGKFVYVFAQKEYEKEFGNKYDKPSVGQKVLAFIFRILPKFGPLKALEFKAPTPETERMFLESLLQTIVSYKELLAKAETGQLKLDNKIIDTGEHVHPGNYMLADKTYAKLLEEHAKDDFKKITPEVKQDILKYFADPNALISLKNDKSKVRKVQRNLDKLKAS